MVLNLLLIQILPANPGSSLKVTAVIIPLYVSQIKLAFNPGVVSCRNNHYDKLFKYSSAQSPGSRVLGSLFHLGYQYTKQFFVSKLPCSAGKTGKLKISHKQYISPDLITIDYNNKIVCFLWQFLHAYLILHILL